MAGCTWLRVVPRTKDELTRMAKPESVPGGANEAIGHTFYDTATYVDNVTTLLPFFQTARANRQATNLATPGVLPEPQFFEIGHFWADVIPPPTLPATTWTDIQQLILGGTNGPPTFTFVLDEKSYGPWPLRSLHSIGGIKGQGTESAAVQRWATSSEPGSVGPAGAWQGGAIVIAPMQGFRAEIAWDTAQDISGNLLIQVGMAGVLHRAIK